MSKRERSTTTTNPPTQRTVVTVPPMESFEEVRQVVTQVATRLQADFVSQLPVTNYEGRRISNVGLPQFADDVVTLKYLVGNQPSPAVTPSSGSGNTAATSANTPAALAPNVASATCTVGLTQWSNVTVATFSGAITLPGSLGTLNAIQILAIPPTGNAAIELGSITPAQVAAAGAGGVITYTGLFDSQIRQTTSAQSGWAIEFVAYNTDWVATSSPYTVSSLTIPAAAVSALGATDDTADRWQDSAGAVHAVVAVDVTLANYPQIITLETTSPQYGRIWHGWFAIAGATTVYLGKEDSGTVLYPPTVGTSETVTVRAAVGTWDSVTPLSGVTGVVATTVSVSGPLAPGSRDAVGWYVTTTAPTYATGPGGASLFGWTITGTLPITSSGSPEKFWAARLCIQTGKYVGGVWTPGGQRPNTPSPTDSSTVVGDYAGPTAWYTQEDHADNVHGNKTSGVITWDNPNLWTVPSDGYDIFRFELFIQSRRNGGTWVQQECWSAAAGTSTPGVNLYQELTVDGSKADVTYISITDSAGANVLIDAAGVGVIVGKTIAGVTHYGQLKYDGLAVNDGVNTTTIDATTGSVAGGKLTWDTNGRVTKYDNTTLAGKGVPFIVYRGTFTGQTGALNFVPTLSGGAALSGFFRINLILEAMKTSGSGTGTVFANAYFSRNQGTSVGQGTVYWESLHGAGSAVQCSWGELVSATSAVFYTDGASTGGYSGVNIQTSVAAWTNGSYNMTIIIEKLDD